MRSALPSTDGANSRPSIWPALIGIAAATIIIAVLSAMVIMKYGEPSNSGQVASGSVLPPTSSVSVGVPPAPVHDFVEGGLPSRIEIKNGDIPVVDTSAVMEAIRKMRSDGNFTLGFPSSNPVIVFDDVAAPWSTLPSSDAKQVMIMGHANRNPPMVFNALSVMPANADRSGYTLVETLPGGVLTSKFVAVHPIPKADLFGWMSSANFPQGTTLVIMCSLDMTTGQPLNTDTAVAWEFHLDSSVANR